jgi:molybdate transport system substrate-binding protein
MLKVKIKMIFIYIFLILIIFSVQISAASEVRVMVAASLQEPLEEIKDKFEAKFAEAELEINYAGSQALFSQIKLGVDFDLFLSANHYYLDQLKKEGLTKKDKIFAQNELIIIINSEKKKAANLKQLLNRDYSLLIGEKSVPVGAYTIEMFNQYLDSIEDQNQKNKLENSFNSAVVSQEFDVKSVLNKVRLGAADAGIVYLSDYNQDYNLHKVEIPKDYNIKANYYMGLSHQAEAEALEFYDYILSSAGQKIMTKYNFRAGEK